MLNGMESAETINYSLLFGFFVLYGIYNLVVGLLILRRNKRILNPEHYLIFFILRITGNRLKAIKMRNRIMRTKDWNNRGFQLVLGGSVGTILALLLWL